MRISKLRKIKRLLDPVIKSKGYFSQIAPLNPEHYKRYIELLNIRFESPIYFSDILTNEENLRTIYLEIDVRTEISVDTNLYVSRLNTNELNYNLELLELSSDQKIDYKFLIDVEEFISEFEIKPEDKLKE